jgi:hypothetical protein
MIPVNAITPALAGQLNLPQYGSCSDARLFARRTFGPNRPSLGSQVVTRYGLSRQPAHQVEQCVRRVAGGEGEKHREDQHLHRQGERQPRRVLVDVNTRDPRSPAAPQTRGSACRRRTGFNAPMMKRASIHIKMDGGKVIDAGAFFDTRDFDAFWSLVTSG